MTAPVCEAAPPARDVDAARHRADLAIAGGADICGRPLDCGGVCALEAGHEGRCLCEGDDGTGCPA